MVELLVSAALGYLLGAVPTGVLVSRALGGVDVREQGSGHTGGLNVSRAAGLGAGALTGVVDALLGVAAVAVALLITDDPWASTAAGAMAVAGHNWSVFIRFGGGIGLSSLAGAVLYTSPLAGLEALGILVLFWLILVGVLRVHRARATIVTMVAVGPLLWALGVSLPSVILGVLGGAAVIVRTLPDWNRQYGEAEE
jgi:glycerol-3-phosphate acyltransferase PlsY